MRFARLCAIVFLTCMLVRSIWRTASPRLVFSRSGLSRPGRAALVWFRPRLFAYGGNWRWLWLPRSISRRLWLVRALGSGFIARRLREADRVNREDLPERPPSEIH